MSDVRALFHADNPLKSRWYILADMAMETTFHNFHRPEIVEGNWRFEIAWDFLDNKIFIMDGLSQKIKER
jgi:hypothetical protein